MEIPNIVKYFLSLDDISTDFPDQNGRSPLYHVVNSKLKDADKSYLYLEFAWCKQEFHKKLLLYQNYEPAQEIFAFILAIVLEKSRNVINPMIREQKPESEILGKISSEITNPIMNLIESEGCNDIMGLSSTEIEGMFHYLTGNCHINWKL